MHKLIIVFLFLSFKLYAIDSIVAIVNEDVITRSQVYKDLADLKENSKNLPNDNILLPKLLDKRIFILLQKQQANKLRIKALPQQIEQQITNIAKGNNLSKEQLLTILKNSNKYNGFIEKVRNEIVMQLLRLRVLHNSDIIVTEKEVNENISSEKTSASKLYKLRNILIEIPSNISNEQFNKEEKKIKLIKKALDEKKTSFRQLAISFSNASNKDTGGDMGYLSLDKVPFIYKKILGKLKVGDHSEVIKDKNGFHIIMLEATKDISSKVEKQLRIRHILIRKDSENAESKINSIYEKILNGESFSKLAKFNSEDLSSKKNGGEIGWVNIEKISKDFYEKVKDLKKSDITKPFITEFGWHIAQNLDSRKIDSSLEKQRIAVKDYLKKQRENEYYTNWLTNLRDNAYIEMYEDKLY